MKRAYIYSALIATAVAFSGCTSNKDIVKNISMELPSANECINQNLSVQNDCYNLISQRNSFAQLRLGIIAELQKKYDVALKRYETAKSMKNFYANTRLANLYSKGLGVKQDMPKARKLLEETKELDPKAAWVLAGFTSKEKKFEETMKLIDFAAKGRVKAAQKTLVQLYSKKNAFTKVDMEKAKYWYNVYQNDKKSYNNIIYGIN